MIEKSKFLGTNLYRYCRNSPLRYSGPTGKRPADPDEAKAYFDEQRKYPKPSRRSPTVRRQPNDLLRGAIVENMSYVALGFDLMGWHYASDWLFRALYDNGDDLYYASDSELAKLVANSSEVLDKVNAFKNGIVSSPVGVSFEIRDLFYAIRNASLYLHKDFPVGCLELYMITIQ